MYLIQIMVLFIKYDIAYKLPNIKFDVINYKITTLPFLSQQRSANPQIQSSSPNPNHSQGLSELEKNLKFSPASATMSHHPLALKLSWFVNCSEVREPSSLDLSSQ